MGKRGFPDDPLEDKQEWVEHRYTPPIFVKLDFLIFCPCKLQVKFCRRDFVQEMHLGL